MAPKPQKSGSFAGVQLQPASPSSQHARQAGQRARQSLAPGKTSAAQAASIARHRPSLAPRPASQARRLTTFCLFRLAWLWTDLEQHLEQMS